MIRTIYVKNFKCFEELSVECRSLNLLTGINGMGKSTIIQALLLLRQTSEIVMQRRVGWARNLQMLSIWATEFLMCFQ